MFFTLIVVFANFSSLSFMRCRENFYLYMARIGNFSDPFDFRRGRKGRTRHAVSNDGKLLESTRLRGSDDP